MVEVAQQSALWYFTNYLENNTNNNQTYNVKDQNWGLKSSNGATTTNSAAWTQMVDIKVKVNSTVEADVGRWKQEQAAILCQYLIDAANDYAKNAIVSMIKSACYTTNAGCKIK